MHPLKLRRERWLGIAVLAAGVVVIVAILMLISKSPAARPGIAIGGVIAIAFFFVVMYLSAISRDTRAAAVSAERPNAIVFNVARTKRLVADLKALTGRDDLALASYVTFACDRSGVSIWTGTRSPVALLEVPWSHLSAVEPSDVFEKVLGSREAVNHLRITLENDDRTVALDVAVERVPPSLSNRHFKDEAEIFDLVTTIRSTKGDRPAPAPVLSNIPGELIPGPTAWAAGRIGPLEWSSFSFIGLPFAAVGIYLGRVAHAPFVVWGSLLGVMVVTVLVGAAFAVRQSRVAARELAAGYTTLNRVNLEVEQRHPKSGRILRAAGSAALSKQQFAEELRR